MMTNNYAMLEIHAGKVVKILSQRSGFTEVLLDIDHIVKKQLIMTISREKCQKVIG